MRRWRGLDEVPEGRGRSVVTLGVFDGVHRGHQRVLARAAGTASGLGLPVVAAVFDPHPDAVLGRGEPEALTGADRKAELLAEHGADAVRVLPFTPELARLPAEEFVRRVLADRLRAAAVVVGEDFRFGSGAAGDVEVLRALGGKYGFTVEEVPLLSDGEAVTSARVRSLLAAGDVAAARDCLGRAHRVEGVVVHGAARGRELLGFPTANLDCPPRTAVPADGVYAGRLLRSAPGGAESRWAAAISVGTNPTFEGTARTVEAYALDRDDLDLYGLRMAVEFTHRIRPMLRFDSVEELVETMGRDVERCRELLLGG
ncbi:bifunctional riboflavin kinase/FAD synthetase [Actinorugispora endophytica]|uniref:Riboflavin biosynthesis protein n=1 Tax=Actinorugispora endophytica TaxID=1605990 RepID=A0A4R6V0K2_9ACTN|nr:bifunctional riboflavin kinase/FAD synthetase [Actinorugispora endophytica]TDQ52133.1 FMN adenylyltransferase /riboflavin kinase [Actinorugispora endophytica]